MARHGQLRDRIIRQPANMDAHADAHVTPALGRFHPPPPQVMVMPMTVVYVTASGQQVAQAVPLYAGPRGAPIPATGPGQWVQLRAAGRA